MISIKLLLFTFAVLLLSGLSRTAPVPTSTSQDLTKRGVIGDLQSDESSWFRAVKKGEVDKFLDEMKQNSGNKTNTYASTIMLSRDCPWFKAVEKGDIKNVKNFLEENPIYLSAKDNCGRTALMRASEYGRLKIVEFLLEKGADVNAKDNYGSTALIIASQRGHLKIVKLLIEKGADVFARDNGRSSALSWASNYKYSRIVKLINDEENKRYQL